MINFLFIVFSLLSTGCKQNVTPTSNPAIAEPRPELNILTGADQTEKYFSLLKGKSIGLIVNQTSTIGNTHLVDSLIKSGIQIKCVYAPEHGFRGDADAGEKIYDSRDSKTGLQVISLYGNKKKPSEADLKGIDVLVFDIQDVGVRFFTYISTLHYIMESAAEQGLPVLLLDRPNPNAHYIDGPVLESPYKSFVGMHPVPVVYGMTIGEYAQMINGENWLAGGIKCNLTVIPCSNYDHQKKYELPVKPSPNLPNLRSILLYPSICFFEGTTVSVGRGTKKQFQVLGHPGIDSDFSFIPVSSPGAKDPLHKGNQCFGTDLSEIPTEKLLVSASLDLSYVLEYYQKATAANEKFFLDNLFFDKLAGTDKLRKQIIEGISEATIKKSWQADLDKFKKVRIKYLLYP